MFRFNWGKLIAFPEFFTLFIILSTYSKSATVACLNFVLASQTEKLISGLHIPATQFNWPTALLYDVFLHWMIGYSFLSIFHLII